MFSILMLRDNGLVMCCFISNYPKVVRIFRTVADVIVEGKVKEDLVKQLHSEKEVDQFEEILCAISRYLVKIKRTWNEISVSSYGPHHYGWSRLLTGLKRSREVYRLIQLDKNIGDTRNENEVKWLKETDIQTMTDSRWNSVYKNLSLLKCNLRVCMRNGE